MKILIVTDSYPPEVRSASTLMEELASGLTERGHAVTVLTCYPSYNLAEGSRIRYPAVAREGGIDVVRVRTMPHHKVNFIVRGIVQLLLPWYFMHAMKKHTEGGFDAVIVYSPPLTLGRVGVRLKKKYGARFILNVQDIFPQNAVDLGVLKFGPVIRWFERIEQAMYLSADAVVVHSPGNRRFIIEHTHVPEEKVFVVHNWIDSSRYRDAVRTGTYRRRFGVDDRLVFLFGGVIGPSQGLELVLDLAEKLRRYEEICFLLVGDGTEKRRLVREAKARELYNVRFFPFVPMEEYPALVKDADVGLVCLSGRNKTPVVPGKILGYMAGGIPVCAFLNSESDGHAIVKDAGCGFSATSGDENAALAAVLDIYGKKENLKVLGERGRKYLGAHFEKAICIERLESLLGARGGEERHV